jgi:Putative GTPase activating protein for Arf
MANLKAQVGDREAAAIKKRLAVWAKESNPACADCLRASPTWASVNLGVLVCLECAGKHRSLGTHISKMRSITLDTILPDEARFLVMMSNDLANNWWEARLDPDSTARAQPTFIRFKYDEKRWALQDASVPVPSRDNVPHRHPWWQGYSEQEASSGVKVPAGASQSDAVNGSVSSAAVALASVSLESHAAASPAPVDGPANLIDLAFDDPPAASTAAVRPAEPDPFAPAPTLDAPPSATAAPAAPVASTDPFSLDTPAKARPSQSTSGQAQPVAAAPSTMADPFALAAASAAPSTSAMPSSAPSTSYVRTQSHRVSCASWCTPVACLKAPHHITPLRTTPLDTHLPPCSTLHRSASAWPSQLLPLCCGGADFLLDCPRGGPRAPRIGRTSAMKVP